MVNILGWIIVGGIAGWLASLFVGRDQQQGCLMNVIVGVVGAAVGGVIHNLITGQGINFSFSSFDITSWTGFVVALVGAVVLLVIVNAVQRR